MSKTEIVVKLNFFKECAIIYSKIKCEKKDGRTVLNRMKETNMARIKLEVDFAFIKTS